MSLIFKKIRYKNFVSSGNDFTEIDFTRNKTTLVVGKNGSGKSTIIEALVFALYGKPYRKITKPMLINSINQKKMLVELEFDANNKQYLIKRGLKPNVFEIYCNDELINQDSNIKDYQEYLETTVLKIGYKSFTQIVVLGSANHVPFMQLTPNIRREVIEDLLDIQIFSLMNSLLKERVSNNKEQLRTMEIDQKIILSKIEMHKKHVQELKQNNNEFIKEKEKEESELISQNDKYTKNMNSLIDMSIKLESKLPKQNFKENLDKLYSIKHKLGISAEKNAKEIEFFEKNNNCPTCKQEILEDFKIQMIENKKQIQKEIDKNSTKAEDQYKKILEKLDKLEQIQNRISEITGKIKDINNKIDSNNEALDRIRKDIKQFESKNKKIEQDVKETQELQEQLNVLISQKTQYLNERELLSLASVLLKDGGIKSRIIRQYIPIINKLIQKYLASMDFFVQFELDENFNETIKSRFRDEFRYDSFSEGEKFRIDLALLFTWRAVSKLRNSATCNLLIMDEVFDSSLDDSGTDEFLKIMNTISQDTNVFVISHRLDTMADKFEHLIKFDKVKNFSKMVA